MTHSLVTEKPIELPEALADFFNNPPLIGTERLEKYQAFCRSIECALKPLNEMSCLLVEDICWLTWEIRRERGMKADIIKLKRKEVLAEQSRRRFRIDVMREQELAKTSETPRRRC